MTGFVVQIAGCRFIIELVRLFVEVDKAIEALEGFVRLLTKFVGNVNVGRVGVRLVGRVTPLSMLCCIGGIVFERLLFKVLVRFIPGKLFAIMVIVDGGCELGMEGREIFGRLLFSKLLFGKLFNCVWALEWDVIKFVVAAVTIA